MAEKRYLEFPVVSRTRKQVQDDLFKQVIAGKGPDEDEEDRSPFAINPLADLARLQRGEGIGGPAPGSLAERFGMEPGPMVSGDQSDWDLLTGGMGDLGKAVGKTVPGVGLGALQLGMGPAEFAIEPLDVWGQTAIEAAQFQKPTLFTEGYTASLEKFRDRPMWQQMLIGLVTDPFVMFQVAKIGIRLSGTALRASIRSELKQIASGTYPDMPQAVVDDAVEALARNSEEAAQKVVTKNADQVAAQMRADARRVHDAAAGRQLKAGAEARQAGREPMSMRQAEEAAGVGAREVPAAAPSPGVGRAREYWTDPVDQPGGYLEGLGPGRDRGQPRRPTPTQLLRQAPHEPSRREAAQEALERSLEDLVDIVDIDNKSTSLRRLGRAMDKLSEETVEGLDDVRDKIDGYHDIQKKGMAPEDYRDAKESAWEEIEESLNNLNAVELEDLEDVLPSTAAREAAQLPRDLSRAKPRYSRSGVVFASDVDRALYIIAQPKKSTRDADYLKFVMDATGLDEAAARKAGRDLKEDLKAVYARTPEGEDMQVPASIHGRGVGDIEDLTARMVEGKTPIDELTKAVPRRPVAEPDKPLQFSGVKPTETGTVLSEERKAIREGSEGVTNRLEAAELRHAAAVDAVAAAKALTRVSPKVRAATGAPRKREALSKALAEERAALVARDFARQDAADAASGGPPGSGRPPTRRTPDEPDDPGEFRESVLAAFREFLFDPEREEEWLTVLGRRHEELARRLGNFGDVYDDYISQGYTVEQSVQKATQTLRGPHPTIDNTIYASITTEVENLLFDEVAEVVKRRPDLGELDLKNTVVALRNALDGKPIPRKAGTAGGSQFKWLADVFGVEFVEGLDNAVARKGGMELVVERGTRGRRAPVLPDDTPLAWITQEVVEESPIPPGTFSTLSPDPRNAQEVALDLLILRQLTGELPPTTGPTPRIKYPPEDWNIVEQPGMLPPTPHPQPPIPPGTFPELPVDIRSVADKELDYLKFKQQTGELPPTTGPTMPRDYPPDIGPQGYLIPESVKQRMIRWAKIAGLHGMDLANLLKANRASLDLSYLRQVVLLIPASPAKFAQSFQDALRAVWSEDYAKMIDAEIRSDPDYKSRYAQGPDFLRSLDDPSALKQAEEYMILSGTRPLQRLARKLPWITISQRAFVTGINSMLWKIYKGHLKMLNRIHDQQARGLITGKEGIRHQLPGVAPIMDYKELERSIDSFADFLADMSGRGRVPGKLITKESEAALHMGLFSLRNNIGRLISPRHLVSPNKYTRQAAWKNWTTAIGFYSGVLIAGEKAGAWEIGSWDPRSSDFGTIIIGGRLRIDVWGGYKQFATLFFRLLPVVGGIKSVEQGGISDFDWGTGILRFASNKASPIASQIMEEFSGKDFRGSPIERADWKRMVGNNVPFLTQDVMEAFQSEGVLGIFAGVGAGIPGFGMYSIPPTLNRIAQEEYGIDYANIPSHTTQGQAARKRVRKLRERGLSEREKRQQEEEDAQKDARDAERKEEKREKWGERPRGGGQPSIPGRGSGRPPVGRPPVVRPPVRRPVPTR